MSSSVVWPELLQSADLELRKVSKWKYFFAALAQRKQHKKYACEKRSCQCSWVMPQPCERANKNNWLEDLIPLRPKSTSPYLHSKLIMSFSSAKQAGLCPKRPSKCHLQRGQRHLFVTSKSLCAPSMTAQGTSTLQPQILGLVHALLVHPWNAAALLKKEDDERCFWEHFC